jgi:single-stranded-DNA-specific exonuclease
MLDSPQTHFLDVDRSVTGRAWVDRLDAVGSRAAQAIAQQTDLSEILSRIVAARGILPADAERYLHPTIRELMPDPSTLTSMDDAAARIVAAIDRKENVALFGDYDVDGACSCALMTRYLRHFDIEPQVHIPDRIFEGYGPNITAIDKLIDNGATLLVTLDCGTVSDEPIAHARSRGIDVVVIDHHLSDFELPVATAIVNPNRPDDVSGLGYLCAAGVTFMVLVAVNRVLRQRGTADLPDLMQLSDLVSLATVCDVVPLVGLNRAFVLRGLEVARSGRNPGISALALAGRLNGPLIPYHFGYIIGPRINAGGRIGDAALGAKLLSLDDDHSSLVIASRLDELNSERKSIEHEATEEAYRAAEAEIGGGEGPPVLILASGTWHPGIVGIVASRVRERFERPTFAIALQPDGTGVGSGRSMPGVDLGAAVIAAVESGLIAKGGGHAAAAGATIKPGQMGPFRAFLYERLAGQVAVAREASALHVDAAISARGVTPELFHDIEQAGPYGSGNPTPIFALPAHRVKVPEVVGQAGHVRLTLASDDGARIRAVAFRSQNTPLGDALLRAGDTPIHVAGSLSLDRYQGVERVELRISDAAMVKG